MGRKVIPETVVITCDACGENFQDVRHNKGATIEVKASALDSQGYAFGPLDDSEYLLCDSCHGDWRDEFDRWRFNKRSARRGYGKS